MFPLPRYIIALSPLFLRICFVLFSSIRGAAGWIYPDFWSFRVFNLYTHYLYFPGLCFLLRISAINGAIDTVEKKKRRTAFLGARKEYTNSILTVHLRFGTWSLRTGILVCATTSIRQDLKKKRGELHIANTYSQIRNAVRLAILDPAPDRDQQARLDDIHPDRPGGLGGFQPQRWVQA